jgi:hypothetical protein
MRGARPTDNIHLAEALEWLEAGFSPLPAREDGTKAPIADVQDGVDDDGKPQWTWSPYQTTPATREHVEGWYANGRPSNGVAGGPGGLEPFEFDDRGVYEAFKAAAVEFGLGDLVERIEAGFLEDTPGGGVHWMWTCSRPGPPMKLAQRPDPSRPHGRRTLIETKGQGGFIIVAPTCGRVHPTGKAYVRVHGSPRTIVAITDEEREALLSLARSLDEMPAEEVKDPPKSRQKAGKNGRWPPEGSSPGDDFNARATWHEIVEPHGWVEVKNGLWRRPGKDKGLSASTQRGGFRVFTTSTCLDAKMYSKFGLHCFLNFGGDFTACAKDLRQRRYGTWLAPDGTEHPNPVPKDWKTKAPEDGSATSGHQAAAGGEAADDRRDVEVNTERHVVVGQVIEILPRDPDLFRRGDVLGIVVQEEGNIANLGSGIELRHARGNPRFLPLSDAMLGCHLTGIARFFAWRKDRNGEFVSASVHPPDWLVKAIATHGYYPGIRHLVSIAGCPYVRADGSIPESGYDPATGALYRPSIELPALPERPTRQDAKDAVGRINEVVIQFPFATGFDWSVWLAALFTAIQRPAIPGPVPGFALNGNKAGCGKGLLIDAVGLIVWGHVIATRSYPTDPVEAAKVKLSLAMAGVPVVHFDNVPEGGTYGNSELDSALTTAMAEGRILGYHRESGPVPLRPVWFLSGNNVSPSRDAYRRWLPCNLVTILENPHERDDIAVKDLNQYLVEHRAGLLSDALIILKAHALEGRPTGGWAALGSFEAWDPVVRGAVWFATEKDCLTTQRKSTEESPDRLDKLALLEGWTQLPGGDGSGNGLTIDEAIRETMADAGMYPMLHAALSKLTGKDGKTPSARSIQNRVRSLQQNVGGFSFQKCGEKNHATLWRVIKL